MAIRTTNLYYVEGIMSAHPSIKQIQHTHEQKRLLIIIITIIIIISILYTTIVVVQLDVDLLLGRNKKLSKQ